MFTKYNMLRSISLIATLLCFSVRTVDSANILAHLFVPSISHQITFQPIIRELALRGHNLTVITPNPINDPSLKTLTEIDVQKISYEIWDNFLPLLMELKGFNLKPMVSVGVKILDAQIAHPKVQDLIVNSSKYHFDMLLLEYPMNGVIIFKRIYNTSLVGLTSMPLHMIGNKYIGNPTHPVLFPELNLPYSNKMTFWQKIHSILYLILGNWLMVYTQEIFGEIIAKHFESNLVNQLGDINKEFDLVLVNNNPILHARKPNVPAVMEFNGIHINPSKDLPTDIKGFLASSIEGAVYISFGSNVITSKLPIAKQEMIIEAISELPYKFLWKFESDITDMPKNLHIMKWVPQQDVLRHQNIKLFVTQGGLQSLDEAMYMKVPVLVIPFFGDQIGNGQKAQEAGLGKTLNFESFTKESFKTAILEIINNQTYKVRMEEVYDILTDQPMSPVDKTVWWIEYVLRHKGAKHMRCPTVDATFIEYYMIDVIAFFVGCLLLLLFLIYITVKLMIKVGKEFFNFVSGRYGDRDKKEKVKKN